MRKILCIFVCILLFGGCSEMKTKDVTEEMLDFGGFECVIHANVNDIEISAKTVYTPFESLLLMYMSPATVQNMKISCNFDEFTAEIGELSFVQSVDKMPNEMICRVLRDCINNARGTTPEYDPESGYAVCKYEVSGRRYELFINRQTACFEKLSVDGKEIITFENFVFL